MGSVRERGFDAVIGVGGIGGGAKSYGIAGKVNWIGIGPHKTPAPTKRGPVITFDHFLEFGIEGPDLRLLAPTLAERLYSKNARHLMSDFREQEYGEAIEILAMAKDAPPSRQPAGKRDQGCPPRWCLARPRKMPDELALVLDGERNTIACFIPAEATKDAEPSAQPDANRKKARSAPVSVVTFTGYRPRPSRTLSVMPRERTTQFRTHSQLLWSHDPPCPSRPAHWLRWRQIDCL